ncbi:hypothetical protein NDU88_001351 [Pleurodeles waltl]|uniref:Uncharacterized protein n=1 Tax=Pleurodeles waltl TaxID=8319 RepID=A0AAV7LB07_PLEWA|nr:hypothetical protein NDU88_001351 [Pleurodeles waltl]
MGRTSHTPGAVLRVSQGNYNPYITITLRHRRRRLKYPEDTGKQERRHGGGRTRSGEKMDEPRGIQRRKRCWTTNSGSRDPETDIAEHQQRHRLETTERESDTCRSRPRSRRSVAQPSM